MKRTEAKKLIVEFINNNKVYMDNAIIHRVDIYLNGIVFDEEESITNCPYCGSIDIKEFNGDIYKYECTNCMELFNKSKP